MHPAVNNGVSGYLRVDDEVLQADALPTADAGDDAIPGSSCRHVFASDRSDNGRDGEYIEPKDLGGDTVYKYAGGAQTCHHATSSNACCC